MSFVLALHPDNSLSFQAIITNPLVDPIYVNDATVTVTVYDSADAEVVGETWPLTLAYVTDSDGEYAKTVNPISGITAGEIYKVVLLVLGADSLAGRWEGVVAATVRGG
ncbi:MAG: hypothetical protein JRJ45_00585 [Deltaproteobacteria bacterium]|nr:hypothetical protein [Deltaproteobacteria bacterium]